MRVERIGNATLYLGDCLSVLPTLGQVDAVITDPPYGIAPNGKRRLHAYKTGLGRVGGNRAATATMYEETPWDEEPFNAEQWAAITAISEHQIVFGWRYFSEVTGKPGSVLAWDKKCKNGWDDDFSDYELAYFSKTAPDRMFRQQWMGMLKQSRETTREHPTQKPLELMEWCVSQVPDASLILDPFMGSGTTGVATLALGKRFIGIETNTKYFDIALRRIDQAQRQDRLFA
jgi:DNA modification methylase